MIIWMVIIFQPSFGRNNLFAASSAFALFTSSAFAFFALPSLFTTSTLALSTTMLSSSSALFAPSNTKRT